MVHTYPLCSPLPSTFTSFSTSNHNLKLSPFTTHSSIQNPNLKSPQNPKLNHPDAKFSPLLKSDIWVNPKNPKAKQLLKNSHYTHRSPLLKLAKSLDSCDPNESQVYEILNGFEGNVTVRDAGYILNNMMKLDNAVFVFRYFVDKIELVNCVGLYNVMMKKFREIRDFEKAEKLFDEMLQRMVKPDVITFSTMISCAALCAMHHKAVEWFEMMGSFGCEPDKNMSASMIGSYACVGNVDVALRLYDRAKEEKWKVDNSSIQKQNAKLNHPDAKFSPLSKSEIWVNPKNPKAKQLLKNFYNNYRSLLLKLAKTLDSCDPNESQVYEILNGFEGNVSVGDAGYILNNMMKLDNAVFVFRYFVEKFDLVKCVILYNVMMKKFREIRKFEKAEKLFDEMLQRRVKPNVSTFSTMIRCAALCAMHHKAVEWFEMMGSFGCEPDKNMWSSIIGSYACVGNVDVALRLYDRAKEEKWKVDQVVFSALIKMYGKLGNYDGCVSVYDDMKVLGVKANMATYNNMLHAMGRAKRTDDVVRIFNQLLDLGISPDDSLCDCLLYVMTQIPKQEHGKITDCIEKVNPKLGFVVRYLMEEREGDEDLRKEALEFFNSIDDYVIKKSLCNNLIDLCVNLKVPDRARDLLNLGLTLEIYTDMQNRSQTKWSLHVKKLSVGAAMTALHVWMDDLSKALESGEELPPVLGIYTGTRKNKYLLSVFESYLKEHNAPFQKDTDMTGWFLTTNEAAKSWLQSRGSSEADAALNSKVLGVPTIALSH